MAVIIFNVLCCLLPSATVSDFETQSVAARRSISSGEIIVTSHLQSKADGEFHRKHHIWFDHNAHRQDVWVASQESDALADARRTSHAWLGDKYFHFKEQHHDELRTVASITQRAASDAVSIEMPIDPRAIGMVATTFPMLMHSAIDYVVGNPARRETAIETVEFDKTECALVSFTNVHGVDVRIWIDPSRGYSVLRIDGSRSVGSHIEQWTADVDIQLYEPSGVWFPESVRYQYTVDGELHEEEHATIEVVSLNEPIETEVFTFAGMGVPKGWPVADHTRPDVSDQLAWDGRQIVSMKKSEVESAEAARWNVIYIGLAFVLAAVAALLLWRFYSSHAAARE